MLARARGNKRVRDVGFNDPAVGIASRDRSWGFQK